MHRRTQVWRQRQECNRHPRLDRPGARPRASSARAAQPASSARAAQPPSPATHHERKGAGLRVLGARDHHVALKGLRGGRRGAGWQGVRAGCRAGGQLGAQGTLQGAAGRMHGAAARRSDLCPAAVRAPARAANVGIGIKLTAEPDSRAATLVPSSSEMPCFTCSARAASDSAEITTAWRGAGRGRRNGMVGERHSSAAGRQAL